MTLVTRAYIKEKYLQLRYTVRVPEKISICFQGSEHTFQCLCVYRILKKHVFLIQ